MLAQIFDHHRDHGRDEQNGVRIPAGEHGGSAVRRETRKDDIAAANKADPHEIAKGRHVKQRRDVQQLRRSEEHTSELQSLMRISYAVFCLKKNTIYLTSTHLTYSKQ